MKDYNLTLRNLRASPLSKNIPTFFSPLSLLNLMIV